RLDLAAEDLLVEPERLGALAVEGEVGEDLHRVLLRANGGSGVGHRAPRPCDHPCVERVGAESTAGRVPVAGAKKGPPANRRPRVRGPCGRCCGQNDRRRPALRAKLWSWSPSMGRKAASSKSNVPM